MVEAPELRLRLTGSELSLLLGGSTLLSLLSVASLPMPSTSTSGSSSQSSVLMRTEQQSAGLLDCLKVADAISPVVLSVGTIA